MTGTDFEALVRVLEDEVEHLGALEALLTDESRALRRLDRIALEALAPQMEAQVSRHLESALARNLALR